MQESESEEYNDFKIDENMQVEETHRDYDLEFNDYESDKDVQAEEKKGD